MATVSGGSPNPIYWLKASAISSAILTPLPIPAPGTLRNKYWETVSLLGVLSFVLKGFQPDRSRITEGKKSPRSVIRQFIRALCPSKRLHATKFCGVHCALMHLADPVRYESIISDSHRRGICAVLGHVVEDPSDDIEVLSEANSENPIQLLRGGRGS